MDPSTMTASRPRLGVMGGTFDPIHHGHLVAASEAAARFDLDEVIFVPTGKPSFKQHQKVTASEHRYLMTVIATASNPRFTVSRVDVDRPGLTYTVDTLRDLRDERPDVDLFFISGADAIEQMLTWKDADDLWKMAHFVAVSVRVTSSASKDCRRVSSPRWRSRARHLLDRLSTPGGGRQPVWYLVPDGVVQYIAKHGLYRGQHHE
ncbi:nicotinate-nucleotide adenylyltransferase [Oerskovia sp. M15]